MTREQQSSHPSGLTRTFPVSEDHPDLKARGAHLAPARAHAGLAYELGGPSPGCQGVHLPSFVPLPRTPKPAGRGACYTRGLGPSRSPSTQRG